MAFRSRWWSVAGVAAALALGAGRAWGQVPDGWQSQAIGGAAPEGAVAVDEDGVWSLKGGGRGIGGGADQLQFVFRHLKGDGSFTARLVAQEGEAPRAGVMLRETTAPGARHLFTGVSAGGGGVVTLRVETDAGAQSLGDDLFAAALPVYLRVQRAGNEVQAFTSADGVLWRAVAGPRRVALPETLLVGLAVSSNTEGQLASAIFDRVLPEEGQVSPTAFVACGGDAGALLTWRPVPGAVGYLVFRGAIDASVDTLVRLTEQPVAQASYTDLAPGLQNGTPVLYAVTPVLRAPDGTQRLGLTTVTATTPTAAPGLRACSIGEPVGPPGSVRFDDATGRITLRATGPSIGGRADRFFFAGRSFQGDFEMTVKLVGPPESAARKRESRRGVPLEPEDGAPPPRAPEALPAGLMVREALEPGSRFFMAFVSPAEGVGLLWRGIADDLTEGPGEPLIDRDRVVFPLWLRIVRSGNTLAAFSSTDGETFAPLGEPYPFVENLPSTLEVGLALVGGGPQRPGVAQFSDFQIEPR